MKLKASCGRWCGNVKIGGFRAAAMPTALMQAPDIYFRVLFSFRVHGKVHNVWNKLTICKQTVGTCLKIKKKTLECTSAAHVDAVDTSSYYMQSTKLDIQIKLSLSVSIRAKSESESKLWTLWKCEVWWITFSSQLCL